MISITTLQTLKLIKRGLYAKPLRSDTLWASYLLLKFLSRDTYLSLWQYCPLLGNILIVLNQPLDNLLAHREIVWIFWSIVNWMPQVSIMKIILNDDAFALFLTISFTLHLLHCDFFECPILFIKICLILFTHNLLEFWSSLLWNF